MIWYTLDLLSCYYTLQYISVNKISIRFTSQWLYTQQYCLIDPKQICSKLSQTVSFVLQYTGKVTSYVQMSCKSHLKPP